MHTICVLSRPCTLSQRHLFNVALCNDGSRTLGQFNEYAASPRDNKLERPLTSTSTSTFSRDGLTLRTEPTGTPLMRTGVPTVIPQANGNSRTHCRKPQPLQTPSMLWHPLAYAPKEVLRSTGDDWFLGCTVLTEHDVLPGKMPWEALCTWYPFPLLPSCPPRAQLVSTIVNPA